MPLKSERIKLGNGIYLNLVKTDKFKSNLLSYYFIRPLSKDEVTKNALLPLVLKRGTSKYGTNLEIEKRLEELYGSNFSVSVNKRGEKQVIRFTMEWANGDFLDNKDHDFAPIEMLKDIIYNPLLENGLFKEDYLSQEKDNLRRKIEGKINDKRSYALERCIEEMCRNEKFSIYHLGYVSDLEKINDNSIFNHYKNFLSTSPIEIFFIGNYNEELISYLKEINQIERNEILPIPKETIVTKIQTKNMVNEILDVNQGKLVLGYRTGIAYDDPLYNGLLLASDILGGGPNSKLFRNVREKEGLAYYITSTIFKYKSIMLIDGGIEFDNFNKTVDIIKNQLDDLKEGKFTNEDIDISKKSIRTSTESIRDSIFLISEFFFSQSLSKDTRSLEEILRDFEKVSKEEIIEAAGKITMDTMYFMKNK